MTKSYHGTKEAKKKPALNFKEKRAQKKGKKDAKEVHQPFLPH